MINVDKTHKSFSLKEHTNNKSKLTLWTYAPYFLSLGMALGLSGCNNSKEMYKEIIEMNAEDKLDYENNHLSTRYIDSDFVSVNFLPVTNDYIDMLPNSLKTLSLCNEKFITDLSNLPEKCPNLEDLYLDNCFGITNFDFIKELPKLKKFSINGDTSGITEDLISYLDSHNIKHNLNKNLVDINNKLDDILKNIITDDMSEEDIINAITYYVTYNIKYDNIGSNSLTKTLEYNAKPLEYALKGKGICINYAALLNALLSKAGVETNVITNHNHAWNLVNIEGKYYYIDPTNISEIPIISKLLLKYADIGFFYKQDPFDTKLSVMSDIDDSYAMVPEKLIEVIKEAEDKKSFIEKYGSNLYVDIIVIVSLLGVGLAINKVKNKLI